MTAFEFLGVPASIVYGLAIARCLDALPSVFSADRRYLPHLAWVCVKLTNPFTLWWSLWEVQGLKTFSFLSFSVLLGISATLYLQVVVLVTSAPQDVTDWRAHYFAKSRTFFATNVALLLGIMATGYLFFPETSTSDVLIGQSSAIVLSAAAMFTVNDRFHAFVAGAACLNMLAMFHTLGVGYPIGA